jgi:hypothetical protein
MRKTTMAMICFVVAALAGCGNFEWFPSSSSGGGGTTPNPPPSSQTITDVQADTITSFLPYTVKFGNTSSSTTTASISVSGDVTSQYSKDNGVNFISTADTVKKGDVVVVRNTSSNYGSNQSISTTLNIGGTTAIYVSKTGTFIFPTLIGQKLGIKAVSNSAEVPATATNFVLGTSATITYSSNNSSNMYINGSSVASPSPTTIKARDTVVFEHVTASTANTTVITTATISGSTGTYIATFKSKTQ